MNEEQNIEALRQLEARLPKMKAADPLPPQPAPKPKQNGNGNNVVELPADRQKAVEYGLTQFQQLGHERDELRKENMKLRDDFAALRIDNEGLNSQLTEALSHVKSMMLIRDEAVARRAEVETVLGSMMAIGRAFRIKSEPLISREDDGDQH